ncbi:hypothetical protein KM043_004874 [Ampulex compressa]|nr:hypothetical protein KM043_004874 [Ampulex compressa]
MALQAMWIRDNMLGERDRCERQLTEAELKVQRSLQKLSIPDWYLNKRSKSPKILKNVVPFEHRLSSWRNTLNDDKSADRSFGKQRDADSPPKQKIQTDEKKVQETTKRYKVPRDAQLSIGRKSPSKSSAKQEKIDTEIPKVVLPTNISKTFPKVSPSRKIQNINIVFPPAPQIDISNVLKENANESKYSTFVTKKRSSEHEARNEIDASETIEGSSWKLIEKKSPSTCDSRDTSFDTFKEDILQRRPITCQKYSTKKELGSTMTDASKRSNDSSWTTIIEEFDRTVTLNSTWTTPTKKSSNDPSGSPGTTRVEKAHPSTYLNSSWLATTKEFHPKNNSFDTPNAKSGFKLRAVSTPKHSSPDYLSSTFTENTSKLSDHTEPDLMGRSSKMENGRRCGRSLIPGIHAIEPIFFEKKKDEEDSSPPAAAAKTSVSVRDLVKELDARNPALLERRNVQLQHSPSTRFLTCRRKSTVLENIVKSKQPERHGRGLIREKIEELNRQCSTESERRREVTTNTRNFVKTLVRTLEKHGTLRAKEASGRSTKREENWKQSESKIGKFQRDENRGFEETNIESNLLSSSERIKRTQNGISSDSSDKSSSSFTSTSFDKRTESENSSEAEIKSASSSTSISFEKETESGSSSEAEAKSSSSSGSLSFKETDSSSDSERRSPASKSEEGERFVFEAPAGSELPKVESDGTCEEEDSVYWIPVSKCTLPRTSSLLSIASRMSMFGQSPCVSPIGKRPEVGSEGWGSTFEKTNGNPSSFDKDPGNPWSRKLFRIDETAVTDSGYSDKSDRSGANSSAGFVPADERRLEEDSGCESKCSRPKRSSARRKTIVGQRTFLV